LAFVYLSNSTFFVIPAKAGIHLFSNVSHEVDPGFRRGVVGEIIAFLKRGK
jgi:hypothetical protein